MFLKLAVIILLSFTQTDTREVSTKNYIWVSIRTENSRDCMGVIIEDYWILTARSCFYNCHAKYPNRPDIGDEAYIATVDGGKYLPKRVIGHPDFRCETRENDIALVELDDKIESKKRSKARKAILYDSNSIKPFDRKLEMLFPYIYDGKKDKKSIYMEMDDITPANSTDAREIYTRVPPHLYTLKVLIGSPLVVRTDSGEDHLVGISKLTCKRILEPSAYSWACPQVDFTRISYYRDWILRVVYNDESDYELDFF